MTRNYYSPTRDSLTNGIREFTGYVVLAQENVLFSLMETPLVQVLTITGNLEMDIRLPVLTVLIIQYISHQVSPLI